VKTKSPRKDTLLESDYIYVTMSVTTNVDHSAHTPASWYHHTNTHTNYNVISVLHSWQPLIIRMCKHQIS